MQLGREWMCCTDGKWQNVSPVIAKEDLGKAKLKQQKTFWLPLITYN